jgi:hypothetical protein
VTDCLDVRKGLALVDGSANVNDFPPRSRLKPMRFRNNNNRTLDNEDKEIEAVL